MNSFLYANLLLLFADFLQGDDMKQNAINIAPSPNLKVSSELLSDKWDAAGEEEAEKRELSNLLLEADNQNKRRSLSKQVIFHLPLILC